MTAKLVLAEGDGKSGPPLCDEPSLATQKWGKFHHHSSNSITETVMPVTGLKSFSCAVDTDAGRTSSASQSGCRRTTRASLTIRTSSPPTTSLHKPSSRDNQASVEKKIRQGMSADAILLSGGVSKGDFDPVRLALGKLGKVVFSRIQMGPGAAFSFGVLEVPTGNHKRIVPVFAMSGPPAGCLINFETLVRPALKKFLGYSLVHHPEVEAQAIDTVFTKAPFSFAKWTELRRTETGYQACFHSEAPMGALSTLASSNALTILEKGSSIQPGDNVKVLPLDWVQ